MDESELRRHTGRLDELKRRTAERLPDLVKARRQFFRTRSKTDQEALQQIERDLAELSDEFSAALSEFEADSGIDPALLDEYEKAQTERYQRDLSRASLVDARVQATRSLDTNVSEALGHLRELVPLAWLDAESHEASRLHFTDMNDFLSLTKGQRTQSEMPSIHRFRQMLFVASDFCASAPRFDHFAGATIVPTIARLGTRLALLDKVGGDVAGRLRRLWDGPSAEVDATVFELLTALACVERGRSIEFIEEGTDRSPDMRSHDPVPLVIECKRQRSLSDYELAEEAIMRDAFYRLRSEARALGCYGTFHLTLTIEAAEVAIADVVAALVAQRLVGDFQQATVYPWGTASYKPASSYVALPRRTRLYSPYLLRTLFGWNTDLPEWDGLCCWYANGDEEIVGEAVAPLALLWNNTSPTALRKRTWAPVHLFGAAASQVPPGEFAIVYVAYTEGAREEVADQRLAAFAERIKAWAHAAEIRLPISFVNRLLPRALDDGRPDLIENAILMRSEEYGELALFEEFPANVFTASPD
jgi:hypothetical protein